MDYIVHGVAKSQTRLSNFHYTRGKVLEVTNHPVFFSAAVVSKEEDTAAPLLPGALEFSVWETSITAFSNTTWDWRSRCCRNDVREQEYFLWESVPIQHYFYAFMPGGDYNVCNEKAFLGPDYKCDYGETAQRHTHTHSSFASHQRTSHTTSSCRAPTALCEITGLSDRCELWPATRAAQKFWLSDWKPCDNAFKVSLLGDKNPKQLAWRHLLGACLVNT